MENHSGGENLFIGTTISNDHDGKQKEYILEKMESGKLWKQLIQVDLGSSESKEGSVFM